MKMMTSRKGKERKGTEGRHSLGPQKVHATNEFVKTVHHVTSSPATVAGRLKIGFGRFKKITVFL